MRREKYVSLIVLMKITVVFASCGEDYSAALGSLNIWIGILRDELDRLQNGTDELQQTSADNTDTISTNMGSI